MVRISRADTDLWRARPHSRCPVPQNGPCRMAPHTTTPLLLPERKETTEHACPLAGLVARPVPGVPFRNGGRSWRASPRGSRAR